MQIRLIDISKEMTDAWKIAFEGVADVAVHNGSIFDIPSEVVVSPANSFGFMDGGIDRVLSEFLGWHVMDRVQEKIRDQFDGELLVVNHWQSIQITKIFLYYCQHQR